LQNILRFKKLLKEDEYFRKEQPEDRSQTNSMNLFLKQVNIDLKIKKATFILIALLLDLKFSKGMASAILTSMGLNEQFIRTIDEFHGEKCVLVEIINRQKTFKFSKEININDFLLNHNECINCDFLCKYRRNEKCAMSTKQLYEILIKFENSKIIYENNGYYEYEF